MNHNNLAYAMNLEIRMMDDNTLSNNYYSHFYHHFYK
jgi:hypothetical protein